MQYTDNYQFNLPTIGVDMADIRTENTNWNKADTIMHASQVSLADAYDSAETYNTDDVVMYEFFMYKCLEDEVTGTWDPTKWERTTASANGAGGGGGSSVIPNPQGTPTDTLSTIGIDGTVFAIAGSGGGTGECVALDNTNRTTLNTQFELSDSVANYDFLIILTRWIGGDGNSFTGSYTIPTASIEYNTGIFIDGGSNDRMSRIKFTDATHYSIVAHNSANDAICGIYGVKLGGGSSEQQDIADMTWTELASTTGTSAAVAIPTGTKKLAVVAIFGGKTTLLACESLNSINKILDITQQTTYILGGSWKDQTGANYGDNSCQISNGFLTAYSSYNTITTKVYALS